MMDELWARVGASLGSMKGKIDERVARSWVKRGQRSLAKGCHKEAVACAIEALTRCSNVRAGHKLMAEAMFPGDDYLTLLDHYHRAMRPETYVEIGVSRGKSLAKANVETRAVGIDPSPRIQHPIRSRAKLYPIPSDEFFDRYDLLEELGASRLAMAFIDGLHHSDQTLKDFINVERYADGETVVFLHDCLPITRSVALREPHSRFWCGDVWKIIPCLKSYRPDLTVHMIAAGPSGLAMITNLDPGSTVLPDHWDEIAARFETQDLDYEYLQMDRVTSADVLPADWERIAPLLSQRPSVSTQKISP